MWPNIFISCSSLQVWFQNRRARTLKCKSSKKSLWQDASYGSPQSSHLTGTEVMERPSPPLVLPYPVQIKEEVEEDCYSSCRSSSSSNICDDSGYDTPSYRSTSLHASPPLISSEQVTPNWALTNDRESPVQTLWRPTNRDTLFSSSGLSQAFYTSPPNTLQTPDSGCWNGGPDYNSPMSGYYLHKPRAFESEDQQDRSLHRGPVPELPALSLQEILGELQGDWCEGDGLQNL